MCIYYSLIRNANLRTFILVKDRILSLKYIQLVFAKIEIY